MTSEEKDARYIAERMVQKRGMTGALLECNNSYSGATTRDGRLYWAMILLVLGEDERLRKAISVTAKVFKDG